jgi:hypothetical protein
MKMYNIIILGHFEIRKTETSSVVAYDKKWRDL